MDIKMNNRSRGFTIVELMISLILSIIIVVGVYSTLTSNQNSYAAVISNQVAINKTRVISNVMDTLLQQSGNRILTQILNHERFSPQNIPNTLEPLHEEWRAMEKVLGTDGGGGIGATNSDSISIRFFPSEFDGINIADTTQDSPTINCSGNTISQSNTPVRITFSVVGDTLVCNDSITNNNVVLIDGGVISMQIQYGVLTNVSNIYLNATQVEGIPAWSSVTKVKIAVLISEDLNRGNIISPANNYQVLDKFITVAANNNSVSQVITKTLFLKN